MDFYNLVVLSCLIAVTSAWSIPFYPVRGPSRVARFTHPPQHHRVKPSLHYPVEAREIESQAQPQQRPKRDHDFDIDHEHDRDHNRDHRDRGITGPVHTFVKTDKNANYKWGVRHHVGNKYASLQIEMACMDDELYLSLKAMPRKI